MKILKTVLLVTSILSAILLWATGQEWMPSLSAFANSDNVVFYRLMHITASWFFLLDARTNKLSYYLAFGMGFILIFDMYQYSLIHNIFTAATLAFAAFTLLYNNTKFERSVMLFITGTAVSIFCVGYFVESFHFLLAEIIAMTSIAIGKLRETWNQ